jgi:hypothetical protein
MAGTSQLGILSPDVAQGACLSSISMGGGLGGGTAGIVGHNLMGIASITTGTTTVAVTFAVPEPSADYIVLLANLTDDAANHAYASGVDTLATTGFNINCNTDPGGTLVVMWLLIRTK